MNVSIGSCEHYLDHYKVSPITNGLQHMSFFTHTKSGASHTEVQRPCNGKLELNIDTESAVEGLQ
jgi:hypothetical protein